MIKKEILLKKKKTKKGKLFNIINGIVIIKNYF